MRLSADIQSLHREYRSEVEGELLGQRIRSAALLFIVLQTTVFIPADWIIHRQHFNEFLAARLAENIVLAFVYFKWSRIDAVQATVVTALTGSALFLFMVHETGGVESGYYVGLILLLVGLGYGSYNHKFRSFSWKQGINNFTPLGARLVSRP